MLILLKRYSPAIKNVQVTSKPVALLQQLGYANVQAAANSIQRDWQKRRHENQTRRDQHVVQSAAGQRQIADERQRRRLGHNNQRGTVVNIGYL